MDAPGSTFEALATQHAALVALNDVAEAAGAAPDLPAFLRSACERLSTVVDCSCVAFFRLDPGQPEASLLHLHGDGAGHDHRLARVPLDLVLPADGAAAAVRQVEALRGDPAAALRSAPLATLATVPVLFRSAPVGALCVGYREPRAAADCPLDLLRAMAVHFAAAIQKHQLIDDLQGRVAELTLLNDIAVASAALDPALLVDGALHRIASTFRADAAAAFVAEGDDLVQVAAFGVSPETARRGERRPADTGILGRAFAARKPVHLPGLARDGGVQGWIREREGIAAAVAVPLLVKDRALGAFALGRRREEPFSDADIALLSAIGVQLGIAVENARLFSDTRRRVADLEAVNALAQRVFHTAPGDAQALLAESTREIAQALSARSVVVLQLDATGTRLEGAAGWGTPLPPAGLTIPLARSELARRAIESRQPVWGQHVFDDHVAAELSPPQLSLLLVPLTSRRTTRGLVAIGDVPQRRFSDAELALASALASEVAVGMENAELYGEARRRVEELSLLNELGRAVAGSLDLERTLAEGARAVNRLVQASACYVLLLEGQELRFAASTTDAEILRGTTLALGGRSLAAQAARERRPIAVEDALRSPLVDQQLAQRYGAVSLLAAPLLVRGEPAGVVIVAQRERLRRFTDAEVERVMAVANQLAVAIENARLYEDLSRSYGELARAQDQLVHQERLAALGQLAAVVAHEVRNPLGVIFNSLGALRRLVQPSGDARMLFEMMGEEADRLNRIVGELLDFAKPSIPDLQPESLESIVDDAIAAALAHQRGKVAVAREADGRLPPVPVDAGLVRQAIVNLAVNALQAMPEGGTLTVRTRVAGEMAVVEVGDTGPGLAEEARRRLFEPFFTTKATGTGLGLALVKRILEDHRGRVEVRRGDPGGTVFALHLPLAPSARPRVDLRRGIGRGSSK